MKREIYLNDRQYRPVPHAGLNAWIAANGLDPAALPIEQTVTVDEEAGTLTVIEFHRYDEGRKVLSPGGTDDGYLKLSHTVPLLSAPENFNL